MSNSTSQNRQGKIKKKGSFARDLPLYLLMIPGLLYLIINNYLPMFGLTFAFKKINYTVLEEVTVEGYSSSQEQATDGSFTLTNSYKPTQIAVKGTAVW